MRTHKNKNMRISINLTIIAALILVCVYLFHIISFSAVIPTFNSSSDEVKSRTSDRVKREIVIEGDIVDKYGYVISSAQNKNENGTVEYNSYSSILGYNDDSGAFGLKEKLYDYLYTPQGKTDKGATVQLTTDTNLQEQIYNMLIDKDASAVVLNNKTGEILALVSTFGGVDIDVNLIHENYEKYLNAGFFCPNAISDIASPGSAYKMVTAASIIEAGYEDEIFYDTGTITLPNGVVLDNYNSHTMGEVTAREAFVNSLNTYFAYYTVLCKENFIDVSNRFLLGKDIELDFTTLTSAAIPEDMDYTQTAMSGFGQGAIELSPLHLAMITQTIANRGKMLLPYLISSVKNDKEEIYKGKTQEISQPISSATADVIASYMNDAAISYGAYGICAKTGTADLPSDMNRAVYASFNENYTVVITEKETADLGISLQNYAVEIYKMLDK